MDMTAVKRLMLRTRLPDFEAGIASRSDRVY